MLRFGSFCRKCLFHQLREPEYKDKSIREIVTEMYSYADLSTMSGKKDGIVNIGGFIGFRSEEIFRQATTFNIMFEGYITYGGMAGRDMNAMAEGLRGEYYFRIFRDTYTSSRISRETTHRFWNSYTTTCWRTCSFCGCTEVSA